MIKKIKQIPESELGETDLIAVLPGIHYPHIKDNLNEPIVSDDFLPGLGDYAAYFCQTSSNVKFAIMVPLEVLPPVEIDIYSNDKNNLNEILAELEIEFSEDIKTE